MNKSKNDKKPEFTEIRVKKIGGDSSNVARPNNKPYLGFGEYQ